jgi:hypothetical protein
VEYCTVVPGSILQVPGNPRELSPTAQHSRLGSSFFSRLGIAPHPLESEADGADGSRGLVVRCNRASRMVVLGFTQWVSQRGTRRRLAECTLMVRHRPTVLRRTKRFHNPG